MISANAGLCLGSRVVCCGGNSRANTIKKLHMGGVPAPSLTCCSVFGQAILFIQTSVSSPIKQVYNYTTYFSRVLWPSSWGQWCAQCSQNQNRTGTHPDNICSSQRSSLLGHYYQKQPLGDEVVVYSSVFPRLTSAGPCWLYLQIISRCHPQMPLARFLPCDPITLYVIQMLYHILCNFVHIKTPLVKYIMLEKGCVFAFFLCFSM